MDKALASAVAAASHYKAVAQDASVLHSQSDFLGANRENVPDYANGSRPTGGAATGGQAKEAYGGNEWLNGGAGFGGGGGGGGGEQQPPRFGRRGSMHEQHADASPRAVGSGGPTAGMMGAIGITSGGLAPGNYADGLRAQVEQRSAREAAARQRDFAAERADDARVERERAQMQAQVDAEIGKQREREDTVRRREEWAAGGWGMGSGSMSGAQPMHGRRASRDATGNPYGHPLGMQQQRQQQQADVAGYMANAMQTLSMDASASSRRGMTPTGGAQQQQQHLQQQHLQQQHLQPPQQQHSVASLRQRQMSSSIF